MILRLFTTGILILGLIFERIEILISVNDLHIAGHARSWGLIPVTYNTREFKRVEELRITDWRKTATG